MAEKPSYVQLIERAKRLKAAQAFMEREPRFVQTGADAVLSLPLDGLPVHASAQQYNGAGAAVITNALQKATGLTGERPVINDEGYATELNITFKNADAGRLNAALEEVGKALTAEITIHAKTEMGMYRQN